MSASLSWADDPLSFLIGPVPTRTFFSDYYEKKYLRCHRGDADRYRGLLSVSRIDEIIADTELPPNSLQMARSKPPLKREDFTFQNGNIDRGAVIWHYQHGATVILPQLQFADAILSDFCHCMERQFSAGVQTNIYLTPPGHQGFNTHYDGHDVFVIQIEGEKHWKIYDKPVDNPYKGEGFHPSKVKGSEVQEEFTLQAGDCVYIPRGVMHDAQSIGDEPSLHITIGILVKTWADLMLEAMSGVALKQASFRRSLPPDYVLDSFDKNEAKKYFEDIVRAFSNEVDFEDTFEMFIDNFIRSQGPIVRGGIATGNNKIERTDNYRKRPFSQYRIRASGEDVIVVCAGGDISFNSAQLENLKHVLSLESFNLDDFNDNPIDASKDILKKLLAFGLIEKIK